MTEQLRSAQLLNRVTQNASRAFERAEPSGKHWLRDYVGPWTGIPLLAFLGMLIGMVVGLLARAVMSIQPLWGKVPSCPTGSGEPSTAVQPPAPSDRW